MKVSIEIDCTPDEVRQFMGLPDVKPMQAAIMAKMEAEMIQAVDRFSPDAMLKSWMSLLPQSAEQYTDIVGRLFRSASDGGKAG